MINNKGKVLKLGQMEHIMKENIWKVERRDMEFCNLLMDQNTQGIWQITKYTDTEFMNGQMGEFIKVIGNKIK